MDRFFLMICISLLVGMAGCHEADEMMFSDVDRVQMRKGEDVVTNFFYMDRAVVTCDTVYLEVHVSGGPRNYLRHVSMVQIPEYDVTYEYDDKGNLLDSTRTEKPDKAVAGIHYVPLDSKEIQSLMVIEPGEVNVKIPVVLLRDASLRTQEVRLCLKLQANEDFLLGEESMLTTTIIFTDKLNRPSRWDSSIERFSFGKYSTRKHEFMYQIAGEKIDDEWLYRLGLDSAEKTFFKDKFKEALAAYNADPDNISSGLAPMREDVNDPQSDLIVFP